MNRAKKYLPIDDEVLYKRFKKIAKQCGMFLGYAGEQALKEWIEKHNPVNERLGNAIKYAKTLSEKETNNEQ